MQTSLVAKTFIINNRDELLVLRRHAKDAHRPGQWDLPGGQVERGEDPLNGATREAYEETKLRIVDLQPVHVVSQVYDGTTQVTKTVFMTKQYDGSVELSWEHSEAKWVSRDEFSHLTISDSYKEAAMRLPAVIAARAT